MDLDSDTRNHRIKFSMHKVRINAQHAIASAAQLPVSPFVSLAPPRVISSIHLDHETGLRREEIHDESEQHDLATKRAAELA
ncbi:MAG TPA: hypothetical protein VGJ26_02720 [Pirellulales bacterium]|jgi:hypothetical protein